MNDFNKNLQQTKLAWKNENMQVDCPACENLLEYDVCQTSNGHKFHWKCLKELLGTAGRCSLCIEDNILPKDDCFKQKDAYIDFAALRDMDEAEVKCDNCGFVGAFREWKKRHVERKCEHVGCTCCIG